MLHVIVCRPGTEDQDDGDWGRLGLVGTIADQQGFELTSLATRGRLCQAYCHHYPAYVLPRYKKTVVFEQKNYFLATSDTLRTKLAGRSVYNSCTV